jgi:SAM-dependent methyltransferase
MVEHDNPDAGAGAIAAPTWTADWFVATLGQELAGVAGVDLEFSIRLAPGCVEDRGRLACWLSGRTPEDFAPVDRLLGRLGAPGAVVEAARRRDRLIRAGLAVSLSEAGPEFRLYLHGRLARTLADDYRAWRWRPGGVVRRSAYQFHFFPETPDGRRPLDFISDDLRPAAALLMADRRLRAASGFWFREGESGRVEQVDLTFPWCPPAGTLLGLPDLARALSIPTGPRPDWRDLPVRHVAFRAGPSLPSITLYTSAPLDSPWPAGEAEFQRRVYRGALAICRSAEEGLYSRLPQPLPGPDSPEQAGLGRFYDGDVATWRAVLGPGMHYHAGLFDCPEAIPDADAMEAALRRAVTDLYPFLPAGGSVYDVGCGWGGPLAMWAVDLGCPSLGLTISRAQFRHVAGLSLPVRWGDMERTLPPGRFDAAVLLESLCHVHDKARTLRGLRRFVGRLVMRVNCQDGGPAGPAFGRTMPMVDSRRLRQIIESAGWRVRHWRDRRGEALPSVAVWRRRLTTIPPTGDAHLEVLRDWTARVMADPEGWGRQNPLIEVVAD